MVRKVWRRCRCHTRSGMWQETGRKAGCTQWATTAASAGPVKPPELRGYLAERVCRCEMVMRRGHSRCSCRRRRRAVRQKGWMSRPGSVAGQATATRRRWRSLCQRIVLATGFVAAVAAIAAGVVVLLATGGDGWRGWAQQATWAAVALNVQLAVAVAVVAAATAGGNAAIVVTSAETRLPAKKNKSYIYSC